MNEMMNEILERMIEMNEILIDSLKENKVHLGISRVLTH